MVLPSLGLNTNFIISSFHEIIFLPQPIKQNMQNFIVLIIY